MEPLFIYIGAPLAVSLITWIFFRIKKSISNWFHRNIREPLDNINTNMKFTDCRIEIFIDYMKQHSGNGFTEFYDEAIQRKINENNLKRQ
jgi:uncharacterized membrane protein YvbJ